MAVVKLTKSAGTLTIKDRICRETPGGQKRKKARQIMRFSTNSKKFFRLFGGLLLALLFLLPLGALAQEADVVNLLEAPDAEYEFAEGTDLLTIIYPNIHGSDCAIMMYQDEVMMVDCSTDDQSPLLVKPVLEFLGITRVHTAFNTHPHDDHLTGFEFLVPEVTIDRVLVGFPLDYNWVIKRTVSRLGKYNVPFEQVQDGDVLTLGDGDVYMTVIQRTGGSYTDNDKSATLMVQYGDRRIFMAGDIENRGQGGLLNKLPECGVQADILKFPHHGHAPINEDLLALIDPELCIITAHQLPAKVGFAQMEQMNIPAVSTWYGVLRLRTDGNIWVLDELPGYDAPVNK